MRKTGKSRGWRLWLPFILILTLAMLQSCFLFAAAPASGKGSLSISADSDQEISSYRLTGTGPGGESLGPITFVSFPIKIGNLSAGDWSITVEALSSLDNSIVLADATQNLSITDKETTSASFTLVPLPGSGSLQLTIKWPDSIGIDAISGKYASMDGGTAGTFNWTVPVDIASTDGFCTYSGGIDSLPAGIYSFELSFSCAGTSSGPPMAARKTVYKNIANTALVEIPREFYPPNPPSLSPQGGVFALPQAVTISTSTAGAAIYYTTDGSDPGIFSAKYASPISISSSATLKARIVTADKMMSSVVSGNYTILGNGPDNSRSSGSMFIRYGSRFYVLGGKDASGNPLDSVRSAPVYSDGSAGAIAEDAALPKAIAYGAAAAANTFVYVLGGETAGGQLSSAVYFTYINSNGTLGFGGNWLANERPLPTPRSSATAILSDGWIFLIGGDIDTGTTDSIIRARIWQDGQLGMWYPESAVLPRKLRGTAAAILGNRLYVAGGQSGALVSDDFYSYALGSYGSLSDGRAETSLPIPLYNAILLADREDLLLVGGFTSGGSSSSAYRFHGGSWTRESARYADAEGPASGRAAGTLWYLPKGFRNQAESSIPAPLQLSGLSLSPEIPWAAPGSGLVTNNISIKTLAEPGTTLRYTNNGAQVTTSSPVYSDAAPPKASTTVSTIMFRAYASDGSASQQARYDYRIRANNFMNMIAGALQVYPAGHGGTDAIIMREPTNDTATYPSGLEPTSAVWYSVAIASSGNYRLNWADSDVDAGYSARISVSLFESDLYTEVPAIDGAAVSSLDAASASPVHLYLQAGTYYFYAKDKDALKGRNFGVSISRE